MPGGLALLDYNQDGLLDIYLVNGATSPGLERPDASYSNRLFRNLGNRRWEDVTAAAELEGGGYGNGAAAGDYDNDGFPDLYVTGVRRNFLYRNRGDGTFEDVTEKSGANGLTGSRKPWAIAAGWFDYDRDGDHDLFVVNYVKWNPSQEPYCGDATGKIRTYCHPKFYEGEPNILYRNDGNGGFTDVSGEAGIAAHRGKGMGVAFADYDDDGHLDIAVANDTEPTLLFRNQGNGRFAEQALEAGVAFNDDGRAVSGMGIDFRDYDNDAMPDLSISALANETFPLFRNLGRGMFEDATYKTGVGRATMAYSGWGNIIADLDNDGWKDLFAANGGVNFNAEEFSSGKSRQPCLVLANRAGKTFAEIFRTAPALYRGAALGDLNNDGRLDIVVTRLGETPIILWNVTPGGNWLRLRLKLGSRVQLTGAGGSRQMNHVSTSVGYASSSEETVHFGLGNSTAVSRVEIRWPSGKVQLLRNVKANQMLSVTEPAR
jgi:hypothetical protein